MILRPSLVSLSVVIVAAPLTQAWANDPAAEVRQVTSAIRKKTFEAPKAPVLRAAQSVSASEPDQPDGLFVGAVQVEGADIIPVPPLMNAVQKFVGRRLSQDELKKLLSAVANVARQRGYIFARSSIPDQSMVAGVLHVRLDLGHIDEVKVVGLESREIEAILRPLLGHAPKINELDRQLALIADLPGMSVGQPAYALKGDRGVLSVPVKRTAIEGEAFIDNRGLKQLGPVRAGVAAQWNGVFSQRDSLRLQSITTPLDPKELTAVAARYAVQINSSGTEVSGSVAHTISHPRAAGTAGLSTENITTAVDVAITQPVIRTREVSLWLSADYGYTLVRDRLADGSTSRDEIHAAALTVRGYMPLLGGVLSGGGSLTRELDTQGSETALGGAPSGVYVGRGFNLYNGWINWRGDLIGPFHGKLALMGQSTSRHLATIEQISLGGGDYGRAYDPGQRLGDKGRMGSVEIGATLLDRPDGLIRFGETYIFIDGGKVTSVDTAYLPGSLWSGGFGARVNLLDSLRANLEVAYPLWAPDTIKSPRVTASLTSSF